MTLDNTRVAELERENEMLRAIGEGKGWGWVEQQIRSDERQRIQESLVEFIEDHFFTLPAGKLIRILPHEWDDFKAKTFGEAAA